MNEKANSLDQKRLPLVVDLDGSLIKTELPWESFLSVLFRHPLEFMKIILRKIKIKQQAYLKLELEKWADLSLEVVPFSKRFVEYLKEEKASGRRLILCTGSTQSYAEKIQQITGELFDSAWGCTPGKNIVGHKKAMFLVGKYGEKQFDYAGNSLADLKVARYARNFILVNPSFIVLWFSKRIKVYRQFQEKKLDPSFFAETLGFPLWFLNSIIFILPLFLRPSNNLFFPLIFSVVSFNFLATGFNILFRMAHVDSDRKNAIGQSSENLFASGDLSLSVGFFLSGFFLFLAFVSIIYLSIFKPLTVIASLLYIPCVYVLVCKKILKWSVSSFIGYLLLCLVILLQGIFVILF